MAADGAVHVRHDPSAVVAATDRGAWLAPGFAACPECADLHRDLRSILTALALAATPSRPRDYRLTVDDARRLAARPAWRRWLDAFGTRRDQVSRPVGLALTALGVAGLLIGTVPSGLGAASVTFGSAAAATADPPGETRTELAAPFSGAPPIAGAADPGSPLASAAASAAPFAPAEGLRADAPNAPLRGLGASGPEDGADAAARPATVVPDQSRPGPTPFLALSGVLTAAGLGLLLARRALAHRGAMR